MAQVRHHDHLVIKHIESRFCPLLSNFYITNIVLKTNINLVTFN